ncbi:hypothetical protein JQC67_05170 [Aurantibacter crassamenti]|uniref:hypothetical protein n=1 Tax=Aurantibacter crassamenti TaxID=1837375 RepID=UPI00193A02E8|nr:hypothetical protein [Aurantibacter crassamenti]MBM1105528.1 hypothetical protein [Aurantibacter crassamenti]
MNLIETPLKDKAFIRNLIPQKKPFVMVDSLHYFSDDKIVSGFTIESENLFTKNNQFQEPGLIENMAQTIALHKGYTFHLNKLSAPVGYIGAIKKVEIFKLPTINQELTTTINILHEIMDVTLVSATIECEGTLIAQAEIKTALAK